MYLRGMDWTNQANTNTYFEASITNLQTDFTTHSNNGVANIKHLTDLQTNLLITLLPAATNDLSIRVGAVETGKVDRVDTNGWEVGSHAAMVLTNTPDYTDTVAKASAAYPASNPSNFITEVGTVSHTNLTDANGAADVQHLTAAEKAISQIITTNETMDVDGVKYTHTNAPAAANYILEYDPTSSTAQFVAKSSAGTYDHTALTNVNGDADEQHLTAAEKAHAAAAITNETDPVWESEKSGYATGTPVYVESDPVWVADKTGYYTQVESDGLYATGTPIYVEADPVWESEKSGYATGTPLYVYSETDPVWESEKGVMRPARRSMSNPTSAQSLAAR